jgi:hypothetical protein
MKVSFSLLLEAFEIFSGNSISFKPVGDAGKNFELHEKFCA